MNSFSAIVKKIASRIFCLTNIILHLHMTLKKLFIVSSLVIVAGCSSETDDASAPASDMQGTANNNQSESDTDVIIITVSYIDNRLTLEYPASWTVYTNVADSAALLVSVENNEFGGNDKCSVINYELRDNSSLVALTDQLLQKFLDNPEPEITFITVNDEPAARVTGIASVGIGTTKTISQLMYKNNMRYEVVCFGESVEEFAIILDSVQLF